MKNKIKKEGGFFYRVFVHNAELKWLALVCAIAVWLLLGYLVV
ncbi:MAG: hypothetical protein PHW00_02925 [Clostridia bacterium]|nr:hypothetical protein [Clostridia bacterium]